MHYLLAVVPLFVSMTAVNAQGTAWLVWRPVTLTTELRPRLCSSSANPCSSDAPCCSACWSSVHLITYLTHFKCLSGEYGFCGSGSVRGTSSILVIWQPYWFSLVLSGRMQSNGIEHSHFLHAHARLPRCKSHIRWQLSHSAECYEFWW